MKVLGRLMRFRSFLLSNLAVLYEGACKLFVTSRIGAPSLWVLIYAFKLGTLGFMCIRYFNLLFLISELHGWRACYICFRKVSAGSFFRHVMWLLYEGIYFLLQGALMDYNHSFVFIRSG
jgi:hypothetical protein